MTKMGLKLRSISSKRLRLKLNLKCLPKTTLPQAEIHPSYHSSATTTPGHQPNRRQKEAGTHATPATPVLQPERQAAVDSAGWGQYTLPAG